MPDPTELNPGTDLSTTEVSPGTGAVEVDVASGAVPSVTPPTLPDVSAKSVLGLEDDETPKSVLELAAKKLQSQQPKSGLELPRDPNTGKFIRPSAAKPKAVAAKPATPKPEAPAPAAAAPTPKPAQPAPAPKPAAPAKIKVGDKEYTEDELKALLTKQPAPTPQPAPQPAAQPQQPRGPTPEEIQAAEKKFIDGLAAGISVSVSEPELEAILVGGPEGAAALGNLLKSVVARTVLETRKSVIPEFDEHLQNIYGMVSPLANQSVELEKYATEQAFLTNHPEYADDVEFARRVAETLLATYPQQVGQMTREQFIAEVDRQASNIKQEEYKRWRREGDPENWKEYAKARRAAAAAQPQGQPAPVPAAQPAAAPASQPPRPKPPTSNPPGIPGGALNSRSRHAAIAATLQD